MNNSVVVCRMDYGCIGRDVVIGFYFEFLLVGLCGDGNVFFC